MGVLFFPLLFLLFFFLLFFFCAGSSNEDGGGEQRRDDCYVRRDQEASLEAGPLPLPLKKKLEGDAVTYTSHKLKGPK